MYYLCSEKKGADPKNGQRICAFVFAHAKSRFSHEATQFANDWTKNRWTIQNVWQKKSHEYKRSDVHLSQKFIAGFFIATCNMSRSCSLNQKVELGFLQGVEG